MTMAYQNGEAVKVMEIGMEMVTAEEIAGGMEMVTAMEEETAGEINNII